MLFGVDETGLLAQLTSNPFCLPVGPLERTPGMWVMTVGLEGALPGEGCAVGSGHVALPNRDLSQP